MEKLAQEHLTTFFQDRNPPAKRICHCERGLERYLTEGAIIVAFALYLLDKGASGIELHPDGEHGKRFDIRACLESRAFVLHEPRGSTKYAGFYKRNSDILHVSL